MVPLPSRLRLDESAVYYIFIQGRLEPKWSAEFPGMQIRTAKSDDGNTLTCLSGSLADQSSLHGLLNKLRDFNLVLLAIKIDNFEIPDSASWSMV